MTLTHMLWSPRFRAKVGAHLRGDGGAVLLVFHNETEFGDIFDTFAVLSPGK